MRVAMRQTMLLLCGISLACSQPPGANDSAATAGIDSLNARITQAYRSHDPKAYASLYTDSAVFEWPAFNTVRGPAALAAMAESNWASLKGMDLKLAIANRRISPAGATEFGAFEQSWNDSAGARMTEYGRYVSFLVKGSDGVWRMDRFFGFEDSTRKTPAQVR
jgi:ketosteroid isomerase-like protein